MSQPADQKLPPRPAVSASAAAFTFTPRAVAGPAARKPAQSPHTEAYQPPVSASSYTAPYSAYPSSAGGVASYQYPSNVDYGQPQYTAEQYQQAAAAQYDPEYEAQVAQWQSQYTAQPKDDPRKFGNNPTQINATASKGQPAVDRTVVRKGGGKTWEDPSLLEWPEKHPRFFVGNLAGEVTDESLLKAFSKYPSVSRAHVVRDKTSTKSKGFGFVSMADVDEYFLAAKEMQGKYVGSHPILLKKANVEEQKVVVKDERYYKKYHKKGKKGDNHGQKGGQQPDVLHADTGAGVKKPVKSNSNIKMLG